MLFFENKHVFECFVTIKSLICPSCLIIGPNKGDEVITIEEASAMLRSGLDQAAKEGIFKCLPIRTFEN